MAKQADGVWIIDADAKTLYASEAMAQILGATTTEMLGKPSFAYMYPEDEAATQHLFDGKKRGDHKAFHFRLRRKNASPVWVDVQGTPMRNAAGDFVGIVRTFSVSTSQG